ncbi:MAG: hypothetical protein J5775_02190 [Spirochaetales bacterium]|nr:hypothetical protein [Spirochaetales bacterium]
MNKNEIMKTLADRSRELDRLMKNIDRTDLLSIDGEVRCKTQHGQVRFFLRKEDGTFHYLGTDEKSRIGSLCTKSYAVRLRKAAEREKKQMDECVATLASACGRSGEDLADIDLVYGRLPEAVRKYVNPSVVTDDGFARKWQEEKYENRWMKSTYSFKTRRGEKVRSKSECIIANMLDAAGVPYRYEEIVPLNAMFGVFLHPDFTVLNKRTRKVYYWEHFGRMGDPEYAAHALPRISEYLNFGFFPGKDLLMTFESLECPLNTTDVERMIEEYLI